VNAEPVAGRRRRVGGKRGVRGLGVAVAIALLTSACAAGQLAQTAEEQASIDGVNAEIGNIKLRALAIQPPADGPYYPPGSDAALRVVVVNDGTSADTLTSIASPSIADWASYASAADAYAVQVADHAAAKASASASTSASPSASPSTGSSASSAAQPKGSQSVALPPGTRVSYGVPEGKGELLIRKFKTRIYPATTITMTFTFARAGTLTVEVPVQVSSSPGTEVVPPPSSSTVVG
jgi:copper(I)-binding protein